MAVDDARPIPRYGEPYRLYMPMYYETGDITHIDGVTAVLSKDGADFVASTNTPQPIAESGYFYLDLTVPEMTTYALIVEFIPPDPNWKVSPAILYPEQSGDMRTHTLTIASDATNQISFAVLNEGVPGSFNPDSLGGVLGGLLTNLPTKLVLVSPVLDGGNLALVRGDDYLASDGRAVVWSEHSGTWPDLTGATIHLVIDNPRFFKKQITATTPSGTPKVIRAELTTTDTKKLAAASYLFVVEATLASGSKSTLIRGTIRMLGL